MSSSQSQRPAHLYRCFGSDGTLLYIGVSSDHRQRFASHEKHSEWWTQVDRIELTHFALRPDALDAERAAIVAENPVHNVRRNFRATHRPTLVYTDEAAP